MSFNVQRKFPPRHCLSIMSHHLSKMQVVTDTEESALWRMGSPFRGFEFAPEPSLTKLEAHKAESDPESHLGASLEDKHLAVIDRPATAPSPVPLLDTANHTAFSESLLIAEDLHCDSPLPSHLVRVSKSA